MMISSVIPGIHSLRSSPTQLIGQVIGRVIAMGRCSYIKASEHVYSQTLGDIHVEAVLCGIQQSICRPA